MSKITADQKEPIAIIGMACIFPKAPDVNAFWRNILAGVDAIGEPVPNWEAERYLRTNRINTPHGGYLKELYRFDPKEFGIMPNSIDGGEPDQFIALAVACEALRDAGYLGGDYDHRETGIVLGHSTYLHRGQGNLIQHNIVLDQTMELLQAMIPTLDGDTLARVRSSLANKLPQFNADIVPGLVPNVMTGRIANRLNLRGPNYLIDAACASSLLAVGAAIDELRNGRSRMMLAGGVNASLPAEVSVIFTQLGALSKRGKVRPFESGSDGTLLGEGLGVVALKRVSDALADKDKIYAVIHGVGQASDGRGHGLLAPSVEGEMLAIERAYKDSGIDPETIELIEAHGTGIPLGDKTEIAALKQILGERKGAQGTVAIGSVKSMISHCIPAAGIAALIKSALSLHHKVLPPTLCEKINPELEIETTPLYVNTATKSWIAKPGTPRRAGINSFGFGGINAHAILEEAPADACKPQKLSVWPAEICVFSAESDEVLAGKLSRVLNVLASTSEYPVGDMAATLSAEDRNLPHRLALVAKDAQDLQKKINQTLKLLRDNTNARWSTRSGITYSRTPVEGKMAFLFPGEGSQYLNMFSDLALYSDEVRTWFDFWRGLYDDEPGKSRTDILFPTQSELTEQRREELEKRLNDMDVGSEAVFVASQAMHSLLIAYGVAPDVMVGHSTGESSALVASGAIANDDFQQLAKFIRELNTVYQRVFNEGKIPTGALLTVGALPKTVLEEHIASRHDDISIAMDNCANQIVLYGAKHSIDALQKSLTDAGGICLPLPFDRGYHTPQFAAVSRAIGEYYERIGLQKPSIPLYSCASGGLFPQDAKAVRALAARQWSTTVRFRETILKMHRDGVRYFIEVGPSGNLSGFVNDILSGEEYLSLATNARKKNGMEQFLTVLSHLYVNNKGVLLDRLFKSRAVAVLDLEHGAQNRHGGMQLANTMPVIHLNDSDRNLLRKILVVPEEDNTSKDCIACKDRHPAPILQADGQNSPCADDRIMADYFGLMRGFLEQQGRIMEQVGMSQDIIPDRSCSASEFAPFITSILEQDERHVKGECRLSVHDDNFLRDHVLSGPVSEYDHNLLGLSCVPLMVSLEIMAEACALLAGERNVRIIEHVKTFDWIALDDGELTLTVSAKVSDSINNTYEAQVLNAGTIVVSAHYSFEPQWRLSSLPDLGEKRRCQWEGHELYKIGMFHGPIFQSIKHIEGWNEKGMDAQLSPVSLDGFFETNTTPSLILNPVLLDAMGQLAAYWIAEQIGTDFNCFPSTIQRIELYEQCPQNRHGLSLRARQHPMDPGSDGMESPRVWQFESVDQNGKALVRVSNLVNVFYRVPHNFYVVRRDPLNGMLGAPGVNVQTGNAFLWQLPHLPEKFCMQSNGIFLRILAHALLSREERDEWMILSSNVRHRREWLLGRACTKEAVRYWIHRETGKLLYPADIIVLHDERGAPFVDGQWSLSIMPPEVSLSHDRKLSLAAVAAPSNRVGVDVEHIGKVQEPDLLGASFTDNERKSLYHVSDSALPQKALRIWCAKEAAAKYLGLGLQGRPEQFEVAFLDDSWETARVTYVDEVVNVNVRCDSELMVALATDYAAS